jgi:signal transduction histidine kinase
MRVRWWQSIRWRLALGSTLVALIATTLLTLAVIIAINYYYGADERQQLIDIASSTSQRLGVSYVQNGNLVKAVNNVLPATSQQSPEDQDNLLLIFNNSRPVQLIYPHIGNGRSLTAALLVEATDPSIQQGDYAKLATAVFNARFGTMTVDQLGNNTPGTSARLFVVEPIFAGGQSGGRVVGALVVTPRFAAADAIPPFIATVRQFILITAIIVAVLAALAAILFSRTITRPLAKLTSTAHVLTSGDYSARVPAMTGSELGELAETFNKMAAKLEYDVNELHRQELFRRELIMNITHDLATPLTAIAGLGESLLDGVNTSREDYEATGRIIVRETLRLHRMVKDLHVMAKVEAGAMQPQRKALRLAALVDDVLSVLIPEFERANVEPRNAIAYNLPPVWADQDMLKRVFTNLCDNALRHTPSGGMVTIDAQPRGRMLEVSVSDTGEGIPTSALPRIFDRFYRADASRQVSTGGSGLGLTIVRAIIEAHGGTIRAENTPQHSARIVFTLPQVAPEQLSSMTTLPLPSK